MNADFRFERFRWECDYIARQVARFRGSIPKASLAAGYERCALYRTIKTHQLVVDHVNQCVVDRWGKKYPFSP